MIEKRIYEYLNANSNIPAFTEIEEHMPSRFYLIERTGGTSRDHIERATIAIKSYGESMADAAQMNEDLKEIVMEMPTHEGVSAVSLNSDYNYTDTQKRTYRYQAVFDVVYYK